MKIFVINLDKDKDRLEYMSNSFKKYNFKNWERVDAVYGKNLPDLEKYGKILNPSQIGCYKSHLKAYEKIIEQNLEYGVILEDDVTLTDWFPKLEEIIETVPKDFDVVWIGNCRGNMPRNACNLIPDYDYDFLKSKKVGDYVYEITQDSMASRNYPVGGYGLVISKKFIENFLVLPFEEHFKRPIDNFLIENNQLKRYMTVPSIIIHCYDFGSNLCPNTSLYEKLYNIFDVEKKNPYENIWLKYPEQEKEVLELLENVGKVLDKNNINYSLMYGSMLGYGRTKKLISYDDDIDIIIYKKDLEKFENVIKESNISNIFKYKNPILNSSLYYKLYPKSNTINIDSIENNIKEIIRGDKYDYKWPFIDIFVYDLDENNELIDIFSNDNTYIKDETIPIVITSYNTHKTYNFKIFKEYEKLLDKFYKDWRDVCVTSEWNHIKEEPVLLQCSFNCKNVIPDYSNSLENYNQNHHYNNSVFDNRKYYIIILLTILIIIISLSVHFKNYTKRILLFGFIVFFLFLCYYDYIMLYIKKGWREIKKKV